jgi:hypothetical protein
MTYVSSRPDDAYQRLQKLATQQEQAPEAVVESLIAGAVAASNGHRCYDTDEWLAAADATHGRIARGNAASGGKSAGAARTYGPPRSATVQMESLPAVRADLRRASALAHQEQGRHGG